MKQLKKYSEKQKKEETLAKNLRTRRLMPQEVSYFFVWFAFRYVL